MQNDTPLGAVGSAIQGPDEPKAQDSGKLKEFFTDPKNLATMLVLGAALTQPRRGGRKPIAHALKSGAGALAFRGGLDANLEASAAKRRKEESDQEYRDDQVASDREQNRLREQQIGATNTSTQARLTSDLAGIRSRETLTQKEIDANQTIQNQRNAIAEKKNAVKGMQFNPAEAAVDTAKVYSDMLVEWNAGGQQGVRPTERDALERLIPVWNILGLKGAPTMKVEGGLGDGEVEEIPAPSSTTTEKVLSRTATPNQQRAFHEANQREHNRAGRSYAASIIKKGVITDATEAAALRKRVPEWKDLSDSALLDQARRVDDVLESLL